MKFNINKRLQTREQTGKMSNEAKIPHFLNIFIVLRFYLVLTLVYILYIWIICSSSCFNCGFCGFS